MSSANSNAGRAKNAAAWRQKERSHPIMIWLIIRLTRYIGAWFGRALLWPIASWYWLFSPRARKASQQFLRRANVPGARNSWAHIHCFASTLLDRVLMVVGGQQRMIIELEGEHVVLPHVTAQRGVIMLLSHLGSFEMARLRGASLGRPLKVLMDRKQGEKMMAALEAINPDIANSIIDTGVSDTDRVLRVKEALDEGYIVCMMADRGYDGATMVPVDFLGEKTALPMAPFVLASVLKVPLILGFGLREGRGQYRIVFESLAAEINLPRRQRKQAGAQYAQQYADRLAYWAKRYPYNWFNFFDYWAQPGMRPSIPSDASSNHQESR